MINDSLLHPKNIAVIGGSSNITKPGGKLLVNIIGGNFLGDVFVVNPKETEIPGFICVQNVSELPDIDLAILSIPARYCPETVDILALHKNTKAFIIISAGFSEESAEGALFEKQIVERINSTGGCLIGPNCIGLLTTNHRSLFTSLIPDMDEQGCDLISSSGATAVFILESGVTKGLRFASLYSVGNSAQIGVEEVLEYFDISFNPDKSSRIKLLYVESIKNPDKLLFHAASLINKGCRIAAIKAGGSKAGSRAAASHTGALASSDLAVEALFRKAGIVRCLGREELTTVASIFMHPRLNGKNIAIITHAGGPAVMLTDALSKGGLDIPEIKGKEAEELKAQLLPGSSVQNPIDLLATGTAKQLGMVIDYCDNQFDQIDAMMVIFGSTGLVEVYDAYDILHKKMLTASKPIFPILPSIVTASKEVSFFLDKGHVNFPDEVMLASALVKVINTPKPAIDKIDMEGVDIPAIRSILDKLEDGYVPADKIRNILSLAGIPVAGELISSDINTILQGANEIGYPLVAKVVGPVHKSDIGGVSLNIRNEKILGVEFDRLMSLAEAKAVMLQPMLKGHELFVGAKYEPTFGHVILCGLGGIFVEVLKDVSSGLAPLTYEEAFSMIRSLKSYRIIKGTRGQDGVSEQKFAEIIVRLSSLLRYATEIKEMDLNPLIGKEDSIIAVDSRMLIQKG